MKISPVFFVVIITMWSSFHCEQNFKALDSKQFPGIPNFSATKEREGKKLKMNSVCECEVGSMSGGVICANNGIVYKSECQFNCSKKKNPRLKIVVKGKNCFGLNRNSYWEAGGTVKN